MTEYLRSAWYAAAWAQEVGEQLFSTVMLETRVLIYRQGDGSLVAMEDRCPHRFAPLSRGRRNGDGVTCGYHGLTFNAAGQCVHNPFSETIPAAAKVRTFPVTQRHTMIWVWFGEPAAADPTLIPDFSFVEDPMTGRDRLTMEANYELVADNLMDLSHIEFVHAGTFGGQGVIFQGKHEVVQEDDNTVHSNWWMSPVDPPQYARAMFPVGAKINHWLDMRWNAPACMALEIGLGPLDAPKGKGHMQAHILTPATATSTHYFFSFTKKAADDAGDVLSEAFHQEDKPMLEAVQQNMGDTEFWSNRPVMLNVDAGAVRARRVLQQLIEAERRSDAA